MIIYATPLLAFVFLVTLVSQLTGISVRAALSLATLRLSHNWKNHHDVLSTIHHKPQSFGTLVHHFEATHPVELTTSIIRLEHLGLLERLTDTPTSALIATKRGREVLRLAQPLPSITSAHDTDTEEYIATAPSGSRP